jgi:hypothetical protein
LPSLVRYCILLAGRGGSGPILPFCDEIRLAAGAVPQLGKGRRCLGKLTAATTWLEREMQIQVGRFVCTLSLDDRGEIETTWLPWRPKYLSRDERAQYQAGRAAFLERADPGSIVNVVDRLSSAG